MLRPFAHPVACCWMLLGVVAQTLKPVKLANGRSNYETKRLPDLDNLRMPKLQETFTTVAIVCYRYERLAVLQNAFAIIRFVQV